MSTADSGPEKRTRDAVASIVIGAFVNDNGTLALTGAGTSLTTTSFATIGHNSHGTFTISDGTNTSYFWGKVANEDNYILWWMPDPAKFKPLVDAGAIPGTVEKTGIRKKTQPQSVFPILGYTPNGDPIYKTGVPGGPSGGPDGAPPAVLPQILTEQIVLDRIGS